MIQLKIKTEYSFGETFAPIDRVINRLKEIGCTAAGIVDNSTWGHVAWFKACREAEIQPLLGLEIVVNDDETPLKMWFLAKNKNGLSELYRLNSKSYQQKLKTRRGVVNRLYKRDVTSMSDNIFKFAGDITEGDFLYNIQAILDLSPNSLILNTKKRQIAKSHSLTLIEVSDNSFAFKNDSEIFEIASKSGLKVTPQHILEDLDYQYEASMISMLCIALELPKAPMVHEEGDLETLCRDGIKKRFDNKFNPEYEDRLMYELNLIRSKNFESYFIIVADMVRYAKKHMLVGPSRGSAAGSLVCYLSGITEVDPIPAGLFFERFIDINRTDLPDIDLDFPDNKRYMVFDYMSKKYGINNTAHIGTISKFRPRSALIKVCKALNIPLSETYSVKIAMIERMPGDARFNNCLLDTLKETNPGKEFLKEYPQVEMATMIEGHASHTGVHAAGLLICNDEIINYTTVDDKGIVHIEKETAEYLGLLKIDVLGLRTLGILEDSGINIDWYNLSFDDEATFNIFNECRLCGIFQFDGKALRNISKDVEFSSIDDINIVTALARPGPLSSGIDKEFILRKRGKKYKKILSSLNETYGLPIYQEQTMAIVRVVGNFDWTDTIAIRKAIAKSKGKEAIDLYLGKFIKGAMSNGFEEKEARDIWNMINEMGAYQMNKAHTYSYSIISYWTAYLKAYHPLEFAASNLRNAKDDDSAVMLLREMKQEGYEYIPFDLELSEVNWCVKDDKLIGGFTALRGIGEVTAKKLLLARQNGELTNKQLKTINKAENCFADIFPFHTNYQKMYDNPADYGIISKICDISEINEEGDVPSGHGRVFLCELTYKNSRDKNDAKNLKKRNGKKVSGPTEYLDVRLRDDSGEIGGRIDRYDFDRIGKEMLDNVTTGTYLLVRAVFYSDIPWAFIKKWRRLDEK